MEKKPWEIKLTPEQLQEKILESEEYITNYIIAGVDKYKSDVMNWLTNIQMHYYFWRSANDELKQAWQEFKKDLGKVIHDTDSELFRLLESKKNEAFRIKDTMDWTYEICYMKNDYIVIWMKKTGKIKDKDARGYTIALSKQEAPKFHAYCLDNIPKFSK